MHGINLDGKAAIITGSTRGIGKAIAEKFAAAGADVVVSARDADACAAAADEINSSGGGKAYPIAAGIGLKAEVEALVAKAREQMGRIDTLVCNAASNPHHGPLTGISDADFEETFRNNVQSRLWISAAVSSEMIERKSGSIIFISSVAGLRASAIVGAYNISKAADTQLARNLALEYGPHGVRVNCVAPGLIRTEFSKGMWSNEEKLSHALETTPLNRIGEPDDIAGAALFLASDASTFMTGQSIVVDGGLTITMGGV